MKIWTVITQRAEGVFAALYNNPEAAQADAEETVGHWFYERFPVTGPLPKTWQEALAILKQGKAFTFSVEIQEDEISAPVSAFQTSPEAALYIAAARVLYSRDVLEFDDKPMVSAGDDAGAWVQCWRWITDEEAEIDQRPITIHSAKIFWGPEE